MIGQRGTVATLPVRLLPWESKAFVADGDKEHFAPTPLGKYIRARRHAMKLSQEALADRLGYHHSYISQIERGKLPDLDAPDFLTRWSSALEIDPQVLVIEGELWRYNIVPLTPGDLTPGERAVLSAVRHLKDEQRHRIADGLRRMWQEDDTEPPPAPAPED